MPQSRMRPPHAKITILALCGLAAAAGAMAVSAPVHATPSAPVAAYGFDEGSGAQVADASGNSNDGATTARRTDAGRFGRALRMDRRSEAALVPDDASLRLRQAVTLEAWVRPELGRGSRAILVKESGGRVAYALSTSGGRPQAVVNSGSRTHRARAASRLRPGRWTHLAATYDGRSVRLLVGGVEVASTPASGTLLTAPGPLRIGAGGTGGDRFLGRIDEVRVYGSALRRAEIVRDMTRAVREPRKSTKPVIVNPTPTPPITPARPVTSPSDVPPPAGDLPGWRQVFLDDFNTDVASWGDCTSYSEGQACPSLPAVYRDKWWAYANNYQDTRQKVNGDGGFYHPSNMSISNSMLRIPLRRVNGVSQSNAPVPKMKPQTYGRYAIRFKAEPSPVFKIAWLLWRTSAPWGEIDFPEADLDGEISAFNHHPSGQAAFDSHVKLAGAWHTSVVEWTQGSVKFFLDDTLVGQDSGAGVPSTPMEWVIQCETALGGSLPANAPEANIYIDWVAAWQSQAA